MDDLNIFTTGSPFFYIKPGIAMERGFGILKALHRERTPLY